MLCVQDAFCTFRVVFTVSDVVDIFFVTCLYLQITNQMNDELEMFKKEASVA
jgi:hypothetical protein